ncbi:GIY-YIG nuclease family protein [Paenibacillus sp. BSR1-1]|uniref:GIY-YIG nuclease family protein n=1 Tax=Paenibacillus sp. BSR1-1 TaxID=3020845 RepID=UPI0025B02B94|nr:GIY-YIG nuclease family protein [Paenibacillus sp. BSR1-1]MDN3017653.1 GIY-YIG nuclease family protein [Paenibacillus sp. BSR1-1]
MNIKEKVKNLPLSPGVYLMKDSQGRIIYVGKAKSLKKRVQSYFQNLKAHPQKIKKLVANLNDFDYILTDTEFEAFMLECKLIKEIKPIFNRKMKSPKSYTYIVIKMEKDYQILEVTDKFIDNDTNQYFGPFINKYTAERAIQGLKEAFKISCSNPFMKNGPCLNYSLGLCIGMCLGGQALDLYDNIINKIIDLLSGTDFSILEELNQSMINASEQFDFEAAAKYRNILDAINAIIYKEQVIEFTEEDKNFVVRESLTDSTFKLFFIKGNKILFSEKYHLGSTTELELLSNIKEKILTYSNKASSPAKVSKDDLDEAQIIYSYIKSENCSFKIIPENGIESKKTALIDEALYELIYHHK